MLSSLETDLNASDICYMINRASDELKIFEFRSTIYVTAEILDFVAIYSTNLTNLRIRLCDTFY